MKNDEYARRRRKLMREMGRDAIAIVPAAPVKFRNRDVSYFYRQDSDFHYLTGFSEPEAVAVLAPGRPEGEYVLFVRGRDPTREAWDGVRAGPEGAVVIHGADQSFPIGKIDEILPGLLEQRSSLYHTMGVHREFDERVIGWVNGLRAQINRGLRTPQEFVALDHRLHEMRLTKSAAELDAVRRAADLAAGAHRRAMKYVAPGQMEYEVMAEILHELQRNGADASYRPIVGGGANACVLHYQANDSRLEDGDLLLVDAGCEYDCYASDITRTFPVNGRFTSRQRAVYEVVLAAQHAAIAQVRAGNDWNDPHAAAVKIITRGLVRLGLLAGRVPTLVKEEAYTKFFLHRTGHWLGMDVHDVGSYKVDGAWRRLEPGMVMTVEPASTFRQGPRACRRTGGASAYASRMTSS